MNRARTLILLALACLATGAARGQEWRGPASLAVEVKGKPRGSVEGALVILRYQQMEPAAGPRPVLTDAAGRAVVADLAPGVWEVEVSHQDFLSFVALVVLDGGRKPTVQASFLQASGSSLTPIRVKFMDGRGRTPSPSVPLPPDAAARLAARQPPPRLSPPAPAEPPRAATRRAPEPVMPEPELRPLPPTARPTAEPAPPPPAPEPEPEPEPEPMPESAAAPPAEAPAPPAAPAPAPAEPGPAASEPAPPAPMPRPAAPREPEEAAAMAPEPAPQPAASAAAEPPAPEPAPEPPAPEPAPERTAPPTPPSEPATPPAPPSEPTAPPAAPPAPVAPPQPQPAPEAPAPAPPAPPPVEAPAPSASEPAPSPPEPPAAAPPPEPEPAPPPSPAPEPPVPAAVLPPPGPLGPTLRAYRDRTCVECRPGEWALAVETVAGPSTAACDEAALAADGAELARLLGGSIALELKEIAAPAPEALGQMEPGEAATRAAELLGDASSGCRIVAMVIPKAGRFRGLRMEAADASGVGDCQADRPCPVGRARWLGQPRVSREPSANVIWGLFVNEAPDRARRARLTVYFAAPNRAWDPPR